MNLVYGFKKYDELNNNDKNYLIEIYRDYYANYYGLDLFDAFLKVSNTKSSNYAQEKENIKKLTNNYNKAINALMEEVDLLLIYDQVLDLIGSCRLKKIDDNNVRILDIVIDEDTKKYREHYEEVLSFLIDYLTSKRIKKLYLDIPFKEGPLLIRASSLGFIEDDKDIDLNNNKTYLLNKELDNNE